MMSELIRSGFDDAPIGVFDSGYGGLTVAREICRKMPEENIIFVGDSARCPYGPRDGFDDAPIGVFDSGYGGLTVAREICRKMPEENIIFVGDSARCPYGPRDLAEVDQFVQQICSWLVNRGVKMIVIACNTATAAGLAHAQRSFPVPIVGVVEPGARAAVQMTRNRKVGVIATKGTVASNAYSEAIRHIDAGITVFSTATPRFVEIVQMTRNRKVGVIATKGTVASNAYSEAIRHIDAGITVFSTATPRFVEIAELGLKMADGPIESYMAEASKVYIRSEFREIAREYLEPLRRCGVDTLVLGCTHYPLLKALIGGVMGRDVVLVSSAEETARDVEGPLRRCGVDTLVLGCTHYPLLKALIGGVMGRDVVLVSSAEETARDVEGMLRRRGALAHGGNIAQRRFFTSGKDVAEFERFGSRVLSMSMGPVGRVDFSQGDAKEAAL